MAETQHPTPTLTFDDAIEVWRLHDEGWFPHRSAARFNVNQARINEILKEQKHVGSRAAADRGRDAA